MTGHFSNNGVVVTVGTGEKFVNVVGVNEGYQVVQLTAIVMANKFKFYVEIC